jgi:hypothetical protein
MLSISIPARINRDDWESKAELGVEGLVLVRASELFLEAADALDRIASHEDVRGTRDRRVLREEETVEEQRWPEDTAAVDAEMMREVALILRRAGPAVPVLRESVDHRSVRMRIEDRDLLFKLSGKPNVIGVQERHTRAVGVTDAEVPRCAHPPVCVARVFEIPDLLRKSRGQVHGNRGALVGGAVIHEEQFPIRRCLSEGAGDRIPEEPRSVQEDDDD